MYDQTAYEQVAAPLNTEYFLGIWPTGQQDLAAGAIVKPYDGPDAKLVQSELILSSVMSGSVGFDYGNPYASMAPSLPIGLPEDFKGGLEQPYDIVQSQDSLLDNIARFVDLLR